MKSAMLQHALRRPLAVAGFVFSVSSILAFLFVFFALWRPAQVNVATAAATIHTLRQEIGVLEIADRLAEGYSNRLTDVETLEGKLRLPANDPEFIRNLEALASTSGTALRQVSSRPASEERGQIRTSVFEFQVSGNYTSLKQFLMNIQTLPEFVAIEQVLFEVADIGVRARIVIKRTNSQG